MLASDHDKNVCGFPSQILFLQEYMGLITILCDKDYVIVITAVPTFCILFSLNVTDCIFQNWLQ